MNDDARRNRMVDGLLQREPLGPKTEAAMRTVPRHAFVPEGREDAAYRDTPLPIGEGQTISAPHMVAIMTGLLELSPGDRVLEIGAGCGYHAAVTAEVVGAENVYSVEYHEELADSARETLDVIGYGDVSVRVGDGRKGWPEHAPYDRAYLTCAAAEFPGPVIEQVRTGGILLGPIGTGTQVLVKARKNGDGTLEEERHGHVRFVPLK
jgi:protein-L-isoaspartate(D-aspartate) O-methyltransferase